MSHSSWGSRLFQLGRGGEKGGEETFQVRNNGKRSSTTCRVRRREVKEARLKTLIQVRGRIENKTRGGISDWPAGTKTGVPQ